MFLQAAITAIGHDIDNDNLLLALRTSSDGGKTYKLISQVIKNDSEKSESNVHKLSKTKTAKTDKKGRGTKTPAPQDDSKEIDNSNDTKSVETKTDNKDDSNDKDTKLTDKKADNDSDDKDTKLTDKKADNDSNDKDTKLTDKKADNKNFTTSLVKSANTFKFELDTTKLDDGKYLFRFDLSDKLSNFYNHKCAHYYIPVVIDNTKPKLKYSSINCNIITSL